MVSLLVIITTHGAVGTGVAVGGSTGVSEGTGMEVSVGILVAGTVVKVAGGVLDGRPGIGVLVGKIKPGLVGVAGCASQGGT